MKKIVILLLVLLLALSLVSCGDNNKEEKIFDVNALTDNLVNEVYDGTQLDTFSSNKANVMLNIDEECETVFYTASISIIPDCFAIIKINDNLKMEDLVDNINNYIDGLNRDFSAYNPSEVQKIENAYIKYNDKYLVFAITNDVDTAKKIIDNAF